MTHTKIDYADIVTSMSISFPNRRGISDVGLGWPAPILRFQGPRAKQKHGALNFKIKIIINI
jgi:hypothetical protein